MAGLREQKKEIQREEILKHAKLCFWEKGFENTAMSEIAKKSQIAVGTIYNYYESKETLFVEVLRLNIAKDMLKLAKNMENDFSKKEFKLVDELLKTLEIFLKPFEELPKRDVKILVDCIMSGDDSNDTYKIVRKWYKTIEKGFMIKILSKYDLKDSYIRETEIELLIEIISDLTLVNYHKHLNQGLPYEDFENKLKKQLEFILRI